jgi:hypothetical protein
VDKMNLCFAVLVTLVCITQLSSSHDLWLVETLTSNEFSHEDLDLVVEDYVTLSTSQRAVCAMDRLIVQWKSSSSEDLESLSIAFKMTERSVMHRVPLLHTYFDSDTAVNNTNGLIRCLNDDDFCFPKLKSIVAQPEAHILSILFTENTTQPHLPTLAALKQALQITPPLHYRSATGTWSSPDRLDIRTGSAYMKSLLAKHQAGLVIDATARTSTSLPVAPQRGRTAIRPTEPGIYELFVVQQAPIAVSSDGRASQTQLGNGSAAVEAPQVGYYRVDRTPENAQRIIVELCGDAALLPPLSYTTALFDSPAATASDATATAAEVGVQSQASPTQRTRTRSPRPPPMLPMHPKHIFRLQGPVALTGKRPMVLNQAAVSAQVLSFSVDKTVF